MTRAWSEPGASSARRLTGGAMLAGGMLGAALFGSVPFALADPAPAPPNCTAADLEGIRSGVSAATSTYLFTHPDVNAYVTSLDGLPRDQVQTKMKAYMSAHPDVHNEMTGIRQPLVDIRDRCGTPPSPPSP